MNDDYIVKDPMKRITDDHLGTNMIFQEELIRQIEEENSTRRDQIEEFHYNKLVASQEVASMKIFNIEEEQENLKKTYRYTQTL